MKPPYPAVFLYLWCAVGITRAAKIVIVPPIMFESHLYIFKTLASALREQGHQTVFLVSEGREVPHSDHYELQRYPGIFNSSTSDDFLQSKMRNIFSGRLTALELFDILDHYSRNCDMMVGNKALMARLRQEKFDLLLVDPNEMCGFVIAHLLGLKYAVFSTGLWYPAEVGAPAPLAYVPEFNSLLTDRMGLLDRMTNTVVYLLSRFGVNFLVLPKYDRIMRKYNVLPDRSMYQLVSGSCLWMLCTDVALEFPRPTLPNVVYVGGILTKPASTLPQARLLFTCRMATCNDCFGAAIAYQFPKVDPLQSQLCKGCEALLCRSPFIQNRGTCYHLTGCYGNQGWKKWAFLCGTDEEAEICRELIAKRAHRFSFCSSCDGRTFVLSVSRRQSEIVRKLSQE